MVIECTSHEQLVKDFALQVRLIWESWLQSTQRVTDPDGAEQQRKEELLALRSSYSDKLEADDMAQIMRTEAAKYNNLRR